MKTPSACLGTWRIVETDLWDADALDLVGPAHITFEDDDGGSLAMVAIQADIDCRFEGKRVDFSWMGDDDGTPTGGRGWARISRTGTLEGMLFIHRGDEASFRARRRD
jgi:hypothetical protein